MKDKENELTKDEVATLTALQAIARRGDQVHSALGQGRGRNRARARHHGRLETHRHYRSPVRSATGGSSRTPRARQPNSWPWGPSGSPTCTACRCPTTHVLSSGVAGTMAANGSELQWSTVRNLLMAWVLTLPAAIMLSATLYVLFVNIF